MNSEARNQVKFLFANFLYGFYFENLTQEILAENIEKNYDRQALIERFYEAFMSTEKEVLTTEFEQTIETLTNYAEKSLEKGESEEAISPEVVIALFCEIFSPEDIISKTSSENKETEILKLALMLIHKHMAQCLCSEELVNKIMKNTKHKEELIDILKAIIDQSEQEMAISFEEKLYGIKGIVPEKPEVLLKYEEPVKFSKIVNNDKKLEQLEFKVEELEDQNEKLKAENRKYEQDKEFLAKTLKEYKVMREEMFKLKDAKISTLAEEIITLKAKLKDLGNKSIFAPESSLNAVISHIKEEESLSKEKEEFSNKKSEPDSEEDQDSEIDEHELSENDGSEHNSEPESDEESQASDDDEISINFTTNKADGDISYVNERSIMV